MFAFYHTARRQRRRNHRIPSHTPTSRGVVGGCVPSFWLVTIVWSALLLLTLLAGGGALRRAVTTRRWNQQRNENPQQERASRRERNAADRPDAMFPGFPTDFIDVWPEPLNPSKHFLSNILQNHCLDPAGDKNNCPVRQASDTTSLHEIHIELVRSPGVFGRLFGDFVGDFIRTLGDDVGKMIRTTYTTVPNDSGFGMDENPHVTKLMIRLAVLPPALEAMDLALSLNQHHLDKNAAQRLSSLDIVDDDDLAEFTRLWAAWHCQISSFATGGSSGGKRPDIPLLTIPLDLLLAYPMKTEQQMADFMGIALQPDEKRKHVPMERRITQALERIDTCYNLSITQPLLNVPDVPDCSVAMVPGRLRKVAPSWLALVRRILTDGESIASICRTENEQLAICDTTSAKR
jgi:hypothetical protein